FPLKTRTKLECPARADSLAAGNDEVHPRTGPSEKIVGAVDVNDLARSEPRLVGLECRKDRISAHLRQCRLRDRVQVGYARHVFDLDRSLVGARTAAAQGRPGGRIDGRLSLPKRRL